MSKKFFGTIFLVFLLVTSPSPPAAYILPAWKVIQLSKMQNKPAESLKISMNARFISEAAPEGVVSGRIILLASSNGSLRIETKSELGRETIVEENGRAIKVENGSIVYEGEGNGFIFQPFLVPGTDDEAVEYLQKMRIDTDLVCLERYNGRIAYVLGSLPGALEKPQVWIDKETFFVLRFIGFDFLYKFEFPVDCEFQEYHHFQNRLWLPKNMRIMQNGGLKAELTIEEVTINPPIPEGAFNLEILRATAKPPKRPTGPAPEEEKTKEAGRTPAAEGENPIEEFQHILITPGE